MRRYCNTVVGWSGVLVWAFQGKVKGIRFFGNVQCVMALGGFPFAALTSGAVMSWISSRGRSEPVIPIQMFESWMNGDIPHGVFADFLEEHGASEKIINTLRKTSTMFFQVNPLGLILQQFLSLAAMESGMYHKGAVPGMVVDHFVTGPDDSEATAAPGQPGS